jgi:hypothetical protein
VRNLRVAVGVVGCEEQQRGGEGAGSDGGEHGRVTARRGAQQRGGGGPGCLARDHQESLNATQSRVEVARGVAGQQVRAGDAEDAEAGTEQEHEQDDPGRAADQQERSDARGLATEQERGSCSCGEAAGGGGEHDSPGNLDNSQCASGGCGDGQGVAVLAQVGQQVHGHGGDRGTAEHGTSTTAVQPRPGGDGARSSHQDAKRERPGQRGLALPRLCRIRSRNAANE